MALPLLLGLGGSALAGAGMLGGNALLAGALGSGLGSLAQGDDFETAVGTGLMSYFGGKALGGMFGSGADKLANVPQQPLVAGQLPMSGGLAQNMISGGSPVTASAAMQTAAPAASGASNFFSSPAGATIQATGLEGIKQAATNPYALSALGTTGLVEASKPPKMDFKTDDYPDIPQADPAKRERNPILPGYRPGFDPEMPYFRYAEGGEVQRPNDKEIINNAVNAIKGVDPEPERSLAIFVSTYGEEALKDLVGRVRSGEFDDNAQTTEGMVEGIGDGMDDMIPATLEGEQDVVLSDGEFIVPADVVSGLGNGSTDAGSKSLYDMMDRVREMRTGMKEQPDQVPQDMMLPA